MEKIKANNEFLFSKDQLIKLKDGTIKKASELVVGDVIVVNGKTQTIIKLDKRQKDRD